MSAEERLRLLFLEKDEEVEHKRSERIHQGAATLLARWPSYVASAIWGVVFLLSLVTLLMLLIFMLLVRQEKIVERDIFIPPKEGGAAGYIISQEIRSEFCQQMTSKSHEKRQDIPEKDLKIFDSGNNIFYILIKPLTKYSSCSVESVLRLCDDKTVFLLILKKGSKLEYEHMLADEYSNINLATIDGKKLLRGSPFEGQWMENERSVFRAGLLTVWQFGGTVLSKNLLMISKGMYRENTGDCVVDPELVFCPQQCPAYVYTLIGETLRAKDNLTLDRVIDASIANFCGSEHFTYTGCPGALRLEDVCLSPEPKCTFVRLKSWAQTEDWKEIGKHCPATYKQDNVLARKYATRKPSSTTAKPKKTTKAKGTTKHHEHTTKNATKHAKTSKPTTALTKTTHSKADTSGTSALTTSEPVTSSLAAPHQPPSEPTPISMASLIVDID